jgi:hypothetical protein
VEPDRRPSSLEAWLLVAVMAMAQGLSLRPVQLALVELGGVASARSLATPAECCSNATGWFRLRGAEDREPARQLP